MSKSIRVMLAGVLVIPLLALGLSVASPSFSVQQVSAVAEDCSPNGTGGIAGGAKCAQGGGQSDELPTMFVNITNTALYIIGIISVLMLIYGGILYTISGGDSAKVTNAKNTILYAVVGIIIAVLAYAIVNFVLTALGVPAAS